MFAQFFLLTLILPALSDFTIHQESYQRDCIDLTCPKGAFKQISHPLVKDDLKEAQCTICSQCTDFGFSVCAQSRPNILRFRRDIDSHLCTCANSVPVGCKITQRSAKKDPNTEILNVCYLSTLRTPPKPLALNQENEVIATLEPFWLEPYWKEFQLSQLTLFFEFEVKSPELCDEIGNVTTNEGADPPHICTSSLHMEMTGQDIPDGSKKKDYDPTDTEDVEYNGEDDDDAPPEVEFARNVFAGAKHVKLWYTVVVKRPRQLNLLKGEQPFQDVTTVLSSENLKFNLESEVYGEGKEPNAEADNEEDESKTVPSTKSTEGHKKINIVDIDGDKDDPDKEDDKEDEEDPISDGTKDDDEDDDEIKSEDDDDDDDDDEEEVKPTDEGKSTPKEEDDDDDDDDDTEATEATKPTDATDEKDKEEKEVKEDEDDEDKDDEDKEDKEDEEDQDKEEQDKEDKEDEDKEDKEDEEKDDSADDDSAADILDDVNAGNETSSFFEEHFGSWPLVRVGIVLTLVACILIIAAACCYRYRGCCCYSDQQKFTTKTSNGYEYHVTGQAGQEMVGPPETEKLTH